MDNNNVDRKNTFGYKVGQLVANIFTACVAACISACLIALTVRFIMWMF